MSFKGFAYQLLELKTSMIIFCSKKVYRLDHVWRWLNLFHLFNQEEVIKIVQKLRGVIVWSLS